MLWAIRAIYITNNTVQSVTTSPPDIQYAGKDEYKPMQLHQGMAEVMHAIETGSNREQQEERQLSGTGRGKGRGQYTHTH